MPAASYLQTSFLGGKWSTFAQGRADLETYRTGMNECLNSYPVAVGAWVRRQGTLFGATTRSGVKGVVRRFDFSQAQPFTLEFTAGHMRLFAGDALVLENQHEVAAISTANPAVVQTVGNHLLTTGDQVEFNATLLLAGSTTAASGIKPLFNRQFVATVVDATHFSLTDPVTGATIDGSTINTTGWSITVARVIDYAVPYGLNDLDSIRVVQNENVALVLCPGFAPRQITNVGTSNAPVLAFATATFLNGPYLDPPTDGTTLTSSGLSGSVTLTASKVDSINGGAGFKSTDVGRHIAMFYQPAQWSAGTTYSVGQNVTYNNAYYQSIVGGNHNIQPDTDNGTHWAVATTAAAWTWAKITAVTDSLNVIATIQGDDPLGFLPGGSLLGTTPAMAIWQLGLYSDTSGYPIGGTFHEGRFWLYGATDNRIDATMSNNYGTLPQNGLQFAPVMKDGTVADNNGISAIMEGTDVNPIFWAVSTETGVVLGTQAGEWNIIASALDDPITDTSIQAKRKTKYGCANIEPVVAPLATLFVQRYQRHLYEYISDVYSRKFTGTNLAERAQDTILPGIAEIAYQSEPVPICWARTTDNRLVGMTYKRESPFGTQPASFFGWHRHTLGSGREITSLRGGPAPGGNTDSISMVTHDKATGIYFVEFLSPYFDETNTILEADFLDAAVTPASAIISGNNVVFYGLEYIAGKTVSTFLGGVDGGDYTVAADGTLTVPINVAGALLTSAYLASISGGSYGSLNLAIQVSPPGSGFSSPVGAALDYVATSSAPLHYNATTQFDWDANRMYHQQAAAGGDPSTNGHTLFVFNIATRAIVSGPVDPGNLAYGIPVLGYDGHIYYSVGLSANAGRFNTTSLTNDVTYTDSHSLHAPGVTGIITDGANEYLVYGGLNSGQGGPPADSSPIAVINMTAATPYALELGAKGSGTYEFLYADEHPTSVSPGNVTFSRGPVGSAYAAFVGPEGGTGASTLGLYRVSLDGAFVFGVPKIGAHACTDFDAGWSTVGINTMVYDETDGNVVLLLNGTGNSNAYLVKLNTVTGAIMWKTQIHTAVDFHTSRIRGGKLAIIDGPSSPWPLKEVNTLTGAVSASTNETVIGPNTFSTDDGAGGIVVEINDIGTTMWATFGCTNVPSPANITPALAYDVPALLGFTYTSRGQILRAINPQEAGAQEGPALGKTRRIQSVAFMVANAQGMQFGVDFGNSLHTLSFKSPGGTDYTKLQLFTGTVWQELEDDYGFDSMPSWQITRPYPAAVLAVEAFVHTQDRH